MNETQDQIIRADEDRRRARALLATICEALDELNGPKLRATVEIVWDGVPHVKVIPANWPGPIATAHFCGHEWKVDK